MSTYYKYAEQSADSQVNWAQVSKSVSDMLKEEVAIREKKKTALEEAFNADMQRNSNAPQGQWQDGNKFTNDMAHDISNQQLIDYRLLKTGQMSVQDYTLRRQNYSNGINTLFDLQKSYQDVYNDRMEGLLSGKYQALTGSEMQQVEGFKDFSSSKGIINPYTGIISVGKMAPNPKTGIPELTNDVVPVNVLKGKIKTAIPTWDADGSINGIVDKMGENVDVLYRAAGTMRAGTITKVLGLNALEGEYAKKDKDGNPLYPQFKDSIDNINKGMEDAISSAFSNPYNITSVLTQNTGKYNQQSYTYDKSVAEKDKSKILLKIDPLSGIGTLDTDAPNYKAQVQEARDWVRGQMLSKMDSKKELTTTGTTPFAPRETEGEREARAIKKEKMSAVGAWNTLYTGKTAAEKQAAVEILLSSPLAQEKGLLGIDVTVPGKVSLSYDNPKKNITISMVDAGGRPINLGDFAAKGAELHGISDRQEAMKAGGGGTGYGNLSNWSGIKASRQGETPKAAPITAVPLDIFKIKSEKSAKLLQSIIPKGYRVEDVGGPFGNDVTVTAPNGKTYTYNANESEGNRNAEKVLLDKFIAENSGTGAVSGGRVR